MADPRRVAAFIDGSNIYFTMQGLGWTIDWRRFRDFLDRFGRVTDCIYYVGITDDPKQESFLSMLAHSGYSVVTKYLKTMTTADGSTVQKANMDVEMAVDMIARQDTYDLAVLASGDGDMERPLRFLRDRGKDVLVLSTQRRLAKELLLLMGPNFLDIVDHRDALERPRSSPEY